MADPVNVNAIITNAGIAAAVNAGQSGPLIEVTYFRIGERSQAQGAVALATDTDVDDFVYEGSTAQMTYSVIDENTVLYRIILETNIGDFFMGNLGLMMPGGTMFAKAVFPQQVWKYKSVPPAVIGNRKIIDVVLVLSNQAAIVDLTVMVANECSLPVVPTEASLPDPDVAPFSTYLVQNHTQVGHPCLASRFNSEWHFTIERSLPAAGQTILATTEAAFDNTVDIGNAVYWDADAGKYKKADGSVPGKAPIGIRSSTFEITSLGLFEHPTLTPYTPGTIYYVGSGLSAGELVTAPGRFRAGHALSNKRLWVTLGGGNTGTGEVYAPYFNIGYTHNSKVQPIPTTWQTQYTAPADRYTIIYGIHVANYGCTADSRVSGRIYKANVNNTFGFAANMTVRKGHAIDLCRRPLVLMPGDKIDLVANDANRLNAYLTLMESEDNRLFSLGLRLDRTEKVIATFGNNVTVSNILLCNLSPTFDLPCSVYWKNGSSKQAWEDCFVVPSRASVCIIESEKYLLNTDQITGKASCTDDDIDVIVCGRLES